MRLTAPPISLQRSQTISSIFTDFFAVLALGDKHYQAFCAFGHQLDRDLHQCGAQRLFDLIEVDNGDEHALRQWQSQLAQISGHHAAQEWQPLPTTLDIGSTQTT